MSDLHQLAGEAFVNEWYYKVMDSTRLVVAGFYKGDSRLVYLGNAVVGAEQISEFLKALPPTKHSIETLDVHAVPVPGVEQPSSNILVSVGGRVVFGDSVSKQFHQTFLLAQDPEAATGESFYVVSDAFRFV
jgi:hypothetical protein